MCASDWEKKRENTLTTLIGEEKQQQDWWCPGASRSSFLNELYKNKTKTTKLQTNRVRKWETYRRYSACECADDLRHAASRSVQHAVGAGLKQEHAGQVENESWVLCLLQLLSQNLTVQEQGLSANTHIHTSHQYCRANSQKSKTTCRLPLLFLVSLLEHESTYFSTGL